MTPRVAVTLIIACFASALLGLIAGYTLLSADYADTPTVNPSREELRLRSYQAIRPDDFTRAAASVTPAVVAVNAQRLDGGSVAGSAVLIDPAGYLATNYHVIAEAARIVITLSDRREYEAIVVGKDEATDLALLKVAAHDMPALNFGNSDSLRVGEWVLAVGNPFGLRSTVTSGIVSAKGRSIDVLDTDDRIESFIQTDAAVNPGNSGGALVNTAGELVGITTAMLTNSGRDEGVAFAVPANLVRRVLNDLRDYGSVRRALLGAWIQEVNGNQARQLNLASARGAVITSLTPGGAAALGGLETGDVLIAINGRPINGRGQLQEELSNYQPGQRVRVAYVRNGRKRKITIQLRDKAGGVGKLVSSATNADLRRLGFEVRALTSAESQRHPAGGVRVVSVRADRPAGATNMLPGFVVTAINGKPIYSLRHFTDLLEATPRDLLFTGTYDDTEGEYHYRIP